ncbi:MAG: sugar phosphate isomerase/epimerase [Bryobacteraceae bacterium]|nr:sugar phosphate isomerase/epimerase [Bryobacteraceae bacterium]
MPRFSLGSWAFSFGPFARDPVPLERVAERLSQAGYDGIELCGFPPHATVESYGTPDSQAALRRLFDGLGLAVSGYSADLTETNPTAPGKGGRYFDSFRRAADVAAAAGSPAIRIDSVAAPLPMAPAERSAAIERLAETWNRASAYAESIGLRVCWEFEPAFAFHEPLDVTEVYERVAHPNFTLLFDTAHAHMCGVTIDECAGRIGGLHLIDSDGTLYAGETSTHAAFGEGQIDFQALGPKLRALNLPWWTIDPCFRADAWELAKPSLEFAKKLARG